MKSLFVAVCVLVLLYLGKSQGQLSYSYRAGRNQISDAAETLSSPLKVILHNKRFIKASRSKLRPADYNVVDKDAWQDDPNSHQYSKERHMY
ncbi:hypothetical protein ACROYT_G009326 [Oculina patagonica]